MKKVSDLSIICNEDEQSGKLKPKKDVDMAGVNS